MSADQFDPAEHTASEVVDHLAGLLDDEDGVAERQRILNAEEAGAARVTVLRSRPAAGETVQVRLIGASHRASHGDVRDVDAATAKRLVGANLASYVE